MQKTSFWLVGFALVVAMGCSSDEPAKADRGLLPDKGNQVSDMGTSAEAGADGAPDSAGGDLHPRDDGSHPGDDAGVADMAADAAQADQTPDTLAPDTAAPDTLAPDTAAPDTAAPDTLAPDTLAPDTLAPDAGPTTCTASPNSCTNGYQCLGESCSCILAIHGAHYLRSDSTVLNWRFSDAGKVITVAGGAPLSGVTAIYSGAHHACALKQDKTVWCWPFSTLGNNSGQLGNGSVGTLTNADLYIASQVLVASATPLTNVGAITSGSSRGYLASATCAVLEDTNKTLWCWGSNDSSGGGGGSLFNDGGSGHRPYATQIMADAMNPLTDVAAVSLGTRHACAIREVSGTREVWCWGSNIGGPLGQGDETGRTYPVKVNLPGSADQVGAGADATCARVGSAVYCWGSSGSGQLGIGDHTLAANHDGCINYCKLTPKQVVDASGQPLSAVVQLNMAYLAACAKKSDHSLWCWGRSAAVAATDWAIPAVIRSMTLDNVALHSTFSSDGYGNATIFLTRDDTLQLPNKQLGQVCP